MTYLFLAFIWDLWAYRYMWQRIHDTKVLLVDTCTIVFDVFSHWWDWSLGRWHMLFCTTSDHPLHYHKGMFNYAPLWMRTVRQSATRWYCSVFRLKYAFYELMRHRIHNTLIVVDWYLWLVGGKMAEPHLELFYLPFITDISLPHQGEVDS